MSFMEQKSIFNYALPQDYYNQTQLPQEYCDQTQLSQDYYEQAQFNSHLLQFQSPLQSVHDGLSNVPRIISGGTCVDPRQLNRSYSSPVHSMHYAANARSSAMSHNKRANTMDQEPRKRSHSSIMCEPSYMNNVYAVSCDGRPSRGNRRMTTSLPTPPLSPPSQPSAELYPAMFNPGTTRTTGPRSACTHPDCVDPETGKSLKSFSRPADLVRHEKSIHAVVDEEGRRIVKYDCPRPRCNRKGENGFTRADHLIEHRRGYHGEDIPRRRSGSGGDRTNARRR